MIHPLTHNGSRRGTTALARLAWIVLLAGPFSFVAPSVFAESPGGTLAIEHARIVTMEGPTINDGTMVISDGKITAVGSDVDIPETAKRIDAAGRTITPGLIDGYSALGVSTSPRGSSNPTQLAEEAFDRYDTGSLTDALRHGVTSVYVAPASRSGIGGTGAVVRLAADAPDEGAFGKTLKSTASLCIAMPSGGSAPASPASSGSFIMIGGRLYRLGSGSSSSSSGGPISRLKALASLRKQFEGALAYRRTLEDYEDKLAEYTKQLKERAKKKAEEEKKKKEAAKKAAASKSAPATTPAKKATPDSKTPAKPGEKKPTDQAPKKPTRPPRNPAAEVILRALDRQMPVRVAVHRNEDILNVLELAEEFSFDLIIEGAAEAHLLAEEIAEADAAVVLAAPTRNAHAHNDAYRRSLPNQAAVLEEAGIRWIAGSGAQNNDSSRFTLLGAQLATADTSGRDPLKMVTADTAELLKIDESVGRLKPGLLADFVIWSDDPLSPAASVEKVYVDGVLTYEATEQTTPPETSK